MQFAGRSKAYYARLSEPGGPLHDAYFERSSFLIASNEAEVDILTKQADGLRQVGVDSRLLAGSQLEKTMPYLRRNIPLVLEIFNEGHTTGYEVVDRFLNASGATVLRNSLVTGIEIEPANGRCIGVRTTQETLLADDVVVAAGMGSSGLIPGLNVTAQRGQLVITDRREPGCDIQGPLYFATYLAVKAGPSLQTPASSKPEAGIALVIDPLRNGQLLIGSSRESGSDASHTRFSTAQKVLQRVIEYVPQLSELDVLRVFAGIRVRTEDGTPIAGAVSETPGLWLATGFASDGICLAPLIGREMSNLMLGRETLPEFEEFSPARFADLEAGA